VEIAPVLTATVITEKTDVNAVAAFGRLHCVQGLADVANKMDEELQRFGTLVASRVLVGQHPQKIINLRNDTALW
jgi:hypothetical protein